MTIQVDLQGMRFRSNSITSPNQEWGSPKSPFSAVSPKPLNLLQELEEEPVTQGHTTATNLISPPTHLLGLRPVDNADNLERNSIISELSAKESSTYVSALSRNPSLFKELPSLPPDADLSPDLHEVPLSPRVPSRDELVPTLDPSFGAPHSSPPRFGFGLSLPKIPRLQTGDYFKATAFPATLFNPFSKTASSNTSSLSSVQSAHAQPPRLNLLGIHEDNPETKFQCDLPIPIAGLVSPTATGYLYPHREGYSFDPAFGRRLPLDSRAKTASDVRHRNLTIPPPPYSTPGASFISIPGTNSVPIFKLYPNFSSKLPLLRNSTTPNLTTKFPIPRAISIVAGTEKERSNANVESGNPLLLDFGIESVGRWTGYKWILFISVLTVFIYGLGGFVCVLEVWFQTWPHAIVLATSEPDILVLITLASTLLILTSLVGLTGTILNSRPILAFYALLLWPSFISMLTAGYIAYRRSAFALDRKLNEKWSQDLDAGARLVIQTSLRCCGYYNPLHEATLSRKCYPRTQLPGCKQKLYLYERATLSVVYTLVFSLVPVHILNIFVSLLCGNHVNRTFGKGLTPKQYRLTAADVMAESRAIHALFAKAGLNKYAEWEGCVDDERIAGLNRL